MFWMVDDDGTAMFRFRMPDHGPVASLTVERILTDMLNQGIETVTDALLVRKRRMDGEEVVWSGRIVDIARVSQARKHLERLSVSIVNGR